MDDRTSPLLPGDSVLFSPINCTFFDNKVPKGPIKVRKKDSEGDYYLLEEGVYHAFRRDWLVKLPEEKTMKEKKFQVGDVVMINNPNTARRLDDPNHRTIRKITRCSKFKKEHALYEVNTSPPTMYHSKWLVGPLNDNWSELKVGDKVLCRGNHTNLRRKFYNKVVTVHALPHSWDGKDMICLDGDLDCQWWRHELIKLPKSAKLSETEPTKEKVMSDFQEREAEKQLKKNNIRLVEENNSLNKRINGYQIIISGLESRIADAQKRLLEAQTTPPPTNLDPKQYHGACTSCGTELILSSFLHRAVCPNCIRSEEAIPVKEMMRAQLKASKKAKILTGMKKYLSRIFSILLLPTCIILPFPLTMMGIYYGAIQNEDAQEEQTPEMGIDQGWEADLYEDYLEANVQSGEFLPLLRGTSQDSNPEMGENGGLLRVEKDQSDVSPLENTAEF